jgi:hypothetical protein
MGASLYFEAAAVASVPDEAGALAAGADGASATGSPDAPQATIATPAVVNAESRKNSRLETRDARDRLIMLPPLKNVWMLEIDTQRTQRPTATCRID